MKKSKAAMNKERVGISKEQMKAGGVALCCVSVAYVNSERVLGIQRMKKMKENLVTFGQSLVGGERRATNEETRRMEKMRGNVKNLGAGAVVHRRLLKRHA